jgi:hypothetical protein
VLVNVAPPKPERILSEEERWAFLDERSPSGDTLKTETTAEKNINIEMETLPRFLYEKTEEENSISVGPDGQLVVTSAKKPRLILDLNSKDPVEAPLASPDTLSERSSVQNSLSQSSDLDKGKENFRMSLQSPPTLETIQQSPEFRKDDLVEDNRVHSESPAKHCNGNVVQTCAVVESNTPESKDYLEGHSDNVLNDYSENATLLPVSYSERHSPEETLQAEYEDPNYYYSAAGIGYPHGSGGAYHPPIEDTTESNDDVSSETAPLIANTDFSFVETPIHRIKSTCQYQEIHDHSDDTLKTSQSESHLQTLSEMYIMKRSQEQGDIAHLQDAAKVYHSSNMLPIRESLGSTGENEETHLMRANSAEGVSALTSPSTDSDKPLSSVQSDDVFDLPLEESDV